MQTLTLNYQNTMMWGSTFIHRPSSALICRTGLREYADVPKECEKVVVCATKKDEHGADCWDLTKEGRLAGITRGLDCDFQTWLKKAYDAGHRFIHVEY